MLQMENKLINPMNIKTVVLLISCALFQGWNVHAQKDDFSQYPSVEISNNEVNMKVFLPDRKKGV